MLSYAGIAIDVNLSATRYPLRNVEFSRPGR